MERLKNYLYLMRFHKPIPILIILWPTLWALFSAEENIPSKKNIVLFLIGGILMRTIGCIYNDIMDRNFDSRVKRTRYRPIAKKNISVISAAILASFLSLVAIFLLIFLNYLTIFIALCGAVLTSLYPLFKRFFSVPQIVLGVTFNIGIIMSYSQITNSISLKGCLLYVACIFWTISYDTIYAIADKKDDIKIGIQSSAIAFGKKTSLFIMLSQIAMMTFLCIFSVISNYSIVFYIFIILCSLFFIKQKHLCKSNKVRNIIQAFNNNHWIGLIIFIGIVVEHYL